MSDMLRSFAVLALSVIGTTSAHGQNPTRAPSRDSLERLARDRVESGRSHGLAIGMIGADGGSYAVFAGSARFAVPIGEHTVFEIGSITKVFTGILLADMINRGEVRFDQPVAELLPEGTSVPSHGGAVITLGQLATQTSGLPRLPDNMRPADMGNPYADYSVTQMYDFLRRHELRRAPGAQYEYSNLGVGLLGHALALRAGVSYEAIVRERILDPLGMTATGITLSPTMREQMAEGRNPDGAIVPLWDLPTLAGAGGLRSSLHDMMQFLAANRAPPDNAIGRAIALSHAPRFRVNAALSLALNWHISNFRGDTIIWHNGGTGGFRTMLGVNAGAREAMVLLGSSAHDNDDIVRHILMGTPLTEVVVRTEVSLPRDVLASYTGTYEFSPQFAIVITHEDGRLFAQATGQPKFRIYAEARDRFFLRVVEAQLEFTRDAGGAVISMTLVQNGRQTARKVN